MTDEEYERALEHIAFLVLIAAATLVVGALAVVVLYWW
jgi:hypothetical protein